MKIDAIAAVLAATAKGGSVPEVLFSVQIRAKSWQGKSD